MDDDTNNVTLTDTDLTEGQDEATTPGAITETDQTDVVSKTWFTGLPAGARLDCDDEDDDGRLRDRTRSTVPTTPRRTPVRSSDVGPDPDAVLAGVVIDAENLNGANDPDNSAAAGTADFNDACTTDVDGECTFVLNATEAQLGSADICFWVDGDADNVFDPAGNVSDGGDCGEAVGAAESDDLTDVVNKTWEARAIDSIDVTPDSDVNQTGTSHTATATVYDQFGDPIANVNVDWRVTGRNVVATNNTVTNAAGQVTLTYTDTGALAVAGNDTITACTDQTPPHDDCILDAGEVDDVAAKRWIPEAPVAADAEVDMVLCDGNLADLTDVVGAGAWDDEATERRRQHARGLRLGRDGRRRDPRGPHGHVHHGGSRHLRGRRR